MATPDSQQRGGYMNWITLRYSARNWIGSHPFSFPLLGTWPEFKNSIIRRETDICIEGPPRSANSFAVSLFNIWNPGLKIAHHIHVPMQVVYAAKRGIPCIVLLREPLEVFASLMIIDSRLSANTVITSYINFYRRISDQKDRVVVATFEDVIHDFQKVVRSVNAKYGRAFHFDALAQEQVDEILANLEKHNRAKAQSPLLVPVPMKLKDDLKAQVKDTIRSHPLFKQAQAQYEQWRP